MKKVEFVSADLIADIVANPVPLCAELNLTKKQLLSSLNSFLEEAVYEQDVIIENGCNSGYFLDSISPLPSDGSLRSKLTGMATFLPRMQEKVESPHITVIMPTIFRDSKLLDRALQSIVSQTYQNWKVVVVGDGVMPFHIPFSPEVEKELNKRIIITRLGHSGIYPKSGMERWHVAGRDAVNFAIAISSSPILARLDDDDYWLPDHLSTIVEAYGATNGSALIYTQPQKENGQLIFPIADSWKLLPHTNVTFTCTTAYCGKVVGDMFYDSYAQEPGDWRLYKKLLTKGHQFVKIERVTSVHSTESHEDGRVQK